MAKFHVKGESQSQQIAYKSKNPQGERKTYYKTNKRYKTFEADNTGKITPIGWTDWDKKVVDTVNNFQKLEPNSSYAGEFTINFSTRGDAEAEFMDETSTEWGAANITK